MPIEIDWNSHDEANIKQLGYSREWFLKPCHKTTAVRAFTTILNLNDNLKEAYQKLEYAEGKLTLLSDYQDKLDTICQNQKILSENKTQIDVLKKKVQTQNDALKKRNDEIVELTEVNHNLNIAIDNYDTTVGKLETEIEQLKKSEAELLDYKEKYETLVNTLRVLIP